MWTMKKKKDFFKIRFTQNPLFFSLSQFERTHLSDCLRYRFSLSSLYYNSEVLPHTSSLFPLSPFSFGWIVPISFWQITFSNNYIFSIQQGECTDRVVIVSRDYKCMFSSTGGGFFTILKIFFDDVPRRRPPVNVKCAENDVGFVSFLLDSQIGRCTKNVRVDLTRTRKQTLFSLGARP